MNKITIRILNVLTTGILLMTFASCSRNKEEHSEKTVFRYNEATGISSLDPAFANDQSKVWACQHLFNGLVQLDPGLNPIPCIARSWTISDDGRKYIFHLRTDIKFHPHPLLSKGRKVLASDFEFSLKRICDKKTASPGAWVFNALERDSIGEVPFIKSLNDSTLEIRLKEPFPPFIGLLAMPYCSVVPFEIVNHFGKEFRSNPIGTGPFRLHQWTERSALILHKNEQYFETDQEGKSLPYLDAVMISFINDKQSAFLEFLRGRIDFISGLDASYKDDLLTPGGELKKKYKGSFRMETSPYLNTEYLGILADSTLPAMRGNPLKDVRIRKAINYGFDRVRMIRYLRNNMASPGNGGMIPPGIPGFSKPGKYGFDYNPEKASRLLEEAGFPNGKGLPEITMSTTHAYQDLCEYMQGQLADVGIKVKLEINQAAQHRQMVAKQQLPFFRGSWIGDYADAENYLALFLSSNKAPAGPNYTHYSNATFDHLYSEAMKAVRTEKRDSIYHKMDSLVMLQAPVVVLYYDKVVRLIHHNINGLELNAMNLLQLKTVRKTK
jgi:peptide/nickel transport system substrate-binding protein